MTTPRIIFTRLSAILGTLLELALERWVIPSTLAEDLCNVTATKLPDDEEGSIAFEQVEDHGDDAGTVPDPHGFDDDA